MQKIKFKRNLKVRILIFFIIGSTGILITQNLFFSNIEIEELVKPANNTIFTVSNEQEVYFGNSEDTSRNPIIWFSLALDEDTYDCAYLGYAGNGTEGDIIGRIAIGGINEEGLCFDANEISPAYFISYSPSLGLVASYNFRWQTILRECSSVSEVIEWYQTHNMGGWWEYQIHWADKTGNAVIVSPTQDQGIAFTVKNNEYLVSTNFNPVDHSQGWYPCKRYDLVTNRLEDLSNEGKIYRQELIPILNAISCPDNGERIGTIYSNIFELNTLTICLYIHQDFDNEVIFDLEEELSKGNHGYSILSLTDTSTFNRYWALFLSAIGTICLVGIGAFFHFVYKKIMIRKISIDK